MGLSSSLEKKKKKKEKKNIKSLVEEAKNGRSFKGQPQPGYEGR